jgi:purine nucleoside phosphorylase
MNVIEQIQETTQFIRRIIPKTPVVGIILGSGLGNFAT